jgi:hypothetical protein
MRSGVLAMCVVLAGFAAPMVGAGAPWGPGGQAFAAPSQKELEAQYAEEDAKEAAKEDAEEAALDAAMDAAERPGDETLSCDALGVELTSLMSDAKMQAALAKFGAPEALIADLNKQNDGYHRTVAAIRATHLLKYVVMGSPTLSTVLGMVQEALVAKAGAQVNRMATKADSKVAVLTPVMPELARAARVGELANEKGCEFMKTQMQ